MSRDLVLSLLFMGVYFLGFTDGYVMRSRNGKNRHER